MGGGSRLAVSEPVFACLDAVGGCGDAVLVIVVPTCSLSSYGCVAWGLCGVSRLARYRLLLIPGAVALASCRPFDLRRTGREAGRRVLAWILWRGSSCLVDGCI